MTRYICYFRQNYVQFSLVSSQIQRKKVEVMMKKLVVTEEIWKEGNMYTAYCPELDVASCGRNIDEARKNLVEVIEIQLEETAKLGTLQAFLEDAGYDLSTSQLTLQLDKQVVSFDQLTVSFGGI